MAEDRRQKTGAEAVILGSAGSSGADPGLERIMVGAGRVGELRNMEQGITNGE